MTKPAAAVKPREIEPAPKRKRDAAATRAAILASARKAFAAHGYDGAGVREIAAGAGVTAMLVNRYFGSKEQLFAEAVAATMAAPVILTKENLRAENFGETFTASLVALTKPGAAPLDGFEILLRSTGSSARAAEIARKEIEKHHHRNLTEALEGPDAAERAAIALAFVAGFQMMRQMIGLKALAKADPATLTALIAPLMTQLLELDGAKR